MAHMLDHETPREDLALVIRGVVELGDETVVPPLQTFLTLYHADSLFAENADALGVAAEGIFRHGGEEGRQLLQALSAQSRTREPVQVAVQGLFDREQADAAAQAQAEVEAEAAAAAEAARAEAAARPQRLTQAQINEVFVAHTEHLRGCIEGEVERNPQLGQVRIAFIVNRDGTAQEMRFAPNTPEFVACLEPVVAELTFPKFKDRRQRASFRVSLRGDATEGSDEEVVMGPWWERAQQRADASGGERRIGRPWWQVRRAAAAPTQGGESPTPPQGGRGGQAGQGGPQDPPDSGGATEPPGEGEGEGWGGEEGGSGEEPWWLPSE